MRDLERLHDVVEYRVNAGQLKVVFLGVLAVACAIFAVGVTVGKRVDGTTPSLATDPLSELDRATAPANRGGSEGATEERREAPALTYHDELTERPAAAEGDGEAAAVASAAAPAAPAPAARPAPAPAPTPDGPVPSEPARAEERRGGLHASGGVLRDPRRGTAVRCGPARTRTSILPRPDEHRGAGHVVPHSGGPLRLPPRSHAVPAPLRAHRAPPYLPRSPQSLVSTSE